MTNIFTAAEIEAGQIGSYFSEVNIEELFQDVRKSFEYLIEDKA